MMQISEVLVKKKEPEGSFSRMSQILVSNYETLRLRSSVVVYVHHVDTVWQSANVVSENFVRDFANEILAYQISSYIIDFD